MMDAARALCHNCLATPRKGADRQYRFKMTPHNEARPGDYAETVLLPGDPLRAEWIANTFLDDARRVNAVRNCYGFTGFYNGTRVSVQATGMGAPSSAIYATELITVYGARTLIRVGTCGGLNARVKLRDLILAGAAASDSIVTRQGFGDFAFAPAADFALLSDAARLATRLGTPHHVGSVVSSDIFYRPGGLEAYRALIDHGVLAVEMEAASLYTLAARHGARALAICAMIDCMVTGEEIDATGRQSSLHDMITLALGLAAGEAGTA